MFNNFPKRSGIYRINDNIEELRLRLYFRHLNSLLKLPKFDFDSNNTRATSPSNTDDDIQVIDIKWQQKILSASEIELYTDENNCHNDVQRYYYRWLRDGGGAQVDVNNKVPVEDTQKKSGSKSKSKLKRSKKLEKLKQLEDKATNGQSQQRQQIFTYTNHDNHLPVGINKQQISKLLATTPAECMYVYAAIQSNILLIALHWYADDSILHIYPDFSNFYENPYFIKIDADYCHLYSYGFENISIQRKHVPAIDNYLSSNFLNFPTAHWQSEQQLTEEFAMPPKRCRRVVLLLEIRTACDFEYNQIHVRYHTKLPVGAIIEDGLLEASTHTSTAQSQRLHHFGYSWQLTILCEQDCNMQSTDLCRIFFEVISIDSWERERVEGYAYCSYRLRAAPSNQTQHLICLRPVENFIERLERYFIGGRRKFDYESFFLGETTNKNHDDQQHESEFHSRYGCRMQRTGELVISSQQFIQRSCELLHPCAHRRSGMTLDDIMYAYQEARKRLEATILK